MARWRVSCATLTSNRPRSRAILARSSQSLSASSCSVARPISSGMGTRRLGTPPAMRPSSPAATTCSHRAGVSTKPRGRLSSAWRHPPTRSACARTGGPRSSRIGRRPSCCSRHTHKRTPRVSSRRSARGTCQRMRRRSSACARALSSIRACYRGTLARSRLPRFCSPCSPSYHAHSAAASSSARASTSSSTSSSRSRRSDCPRGSSTARHTTTPTSCSSTQARRRPVVPCALRVVGAMHARCISTCVRSCVLCAFVPCAGSRFDFCRPFLQAAAQGVGGHPRV
mmetsp:Transcript_9658/g.24958  ORF Transcript_9658/g.24958 Transcript_9658/m.24958 type:complete len:284 (+) Transcript_9658:765-1616(+)